MIPGEGSNRIEIGGIIFNADPTVKDRLNHLLLEFRSRPQEGIEEEQWMEVVSELLLDRIKDRQDRQILVNEDIDFLWQYFYSHNSSTTLAGLSGVISPLSLVCTFLV